MLFNAKNDPLETKLPTCEECKERARERPSLLLVGPRDPSPAQLSSFSRRKDGPILSGDGAL
jgi:hypothetical protein